MSLTATISSPPRLNLVGANSAQRREEIQSIIAQHEVQQSVSTHDNRLNVIWPEIIDVPYERQPPDMDPTLVLHPRVSRPVSNPEWWERSYPRVPEYRPVNYELDQRERVASSFARFMGIIVIGGCQIMSWGDYVRRHTVGQIVDVAKRIGGEW